MYWRHLVVYATPATALVYATDHWELPRLHHATPVIATATAYGVLMEISRALLPHRTPFLISDILVNAVGVIPVIVWFLIRPYFDRSQHSQ